MHVSLLVRYFNAAHNDSATNAESLRFLLRRQCVILITAHDRIHMTDDGPIRWNSNLDTAPHGEYLKHRLIGAADCRRPQIDFTMAHHGCRAAPTKILR